MQRADRKTFSERDLRLAPRALCYQLLRTLKPHVRILSILIILSAFWISPFSAQTQTDQPTGASELKKGNYENAVRLLTAQLTSTPNDADAETSLLQALIETGRYTDAEASAKKFLLKNAEAANVRHQLA
jgi:tetratricopeptide (TPR) repeat protein